VVGTRSPYLIWTSAGILGLGQDSIVHVYSECPVVCEARKKFFSSLGLSSPPFSAPSPSLPPLSCSHTPVPLFPLPLLLVSETTLIPQPQSLPLTKGEKEHQPKEQVQPPHLGSLLLPLPFARMVILPHL